MEEEKEPDWIEINPGVWKPLLKNDFIEGTYVNFVEGKMNGSNRYYIDTKTGVLLVWGCATLDERMRLVKIGELVRITFLEKKDLGKGKTLNVYKVEKTMPIIRGEEDFL